MCRSVKNVNVRAATTATPVRRRSRILIIRNYLSGCSTGRYAELTSRRSARALPPPHQHRLPPQHGWIACPVLGANQPRMSLSDGFLGAHHEPAARTVVWGRWNRQRIVTYQYPGPAVDKARLPNRPDRTSSI